MSHTAVRPNFAREQFPFFFFGGGGLGTCFTTNDGVQSFTTEDLRIFFEAATSTTYAGLLGFSPLSS